jgi:plastocyanin
MISKRLSCLIATLGWHLLASAASVTVQVVSANEKPLTDAVVYLDSAEARASVQPLKQVEIVQQHRRFVPKVTVIPVGSEVQFPNRDNVRHHVYSFSPTKSFELKLYAGTPAEPVVFDKPGIAVLGCNIHDSMVAWVAVVETPYYGRTDAEGLITLAQVPAGSYRLRAWHSDLPPGSPVSDAALQVGPVSAVAKVRLGITVK